MEGSEPEILVNAEGDRTTPSVEGFRKDGERVVGKSAKNQAVTNPENTVSSVKRFIGRSFAETAEEQKTVAYKVRSGKDGRAVIDIDGKDYTPEEISAMVLQKLKADAEARIGSPITQAVITVPAYFNDAQRQATKDAGKIAGLEVLRIINEPTAAALAYGLDKADHDEKILVFDLGGGTFDVSIIEIGDNVIEVLATAGNNHLGGDDFDARLADYLANAFKRRTGVDLSRDAMAMQRIREAAQQAKKELSSMESTTVNLPFLSQGPSGPLHLEETVTRDAFNQLTRDLVEATTGPVQQALGDAGIAASELGSVLLVGGSTRIPAVQEHVQKLTGKRPSASVNPDECVAQGAAIQGSTLANAAGGIVPRGGGLLLLDVVPMSFAIETVGGVATRVIERNTTLPIHYEQIFTTAASFQTKVEIHVLQGERPMARDNKTIGKFQLKGIKRAPAGVPQINVSFDIDANGILTVSAKDLGTGNEQSITITDSERMTDEEIQAAIADAEKYAAEDQARRDSFAQRDEAQRLVSDAENIIKERGKTLDKQLKKDLRAASGEVSRYLMKRPEKMKDDDHAKLATAVEHLRDAITRVQ